MKKGTDKLSRVQQRTTELVRELEHVMYKENLKSGYCENGKAKDGGGVRWGGLVSSCCLELMSSYEEDKSWILLGGA